MCEALPPTLEQSTGWLDASSSHVCRCYLQLAHISYNINVMRSAKTFKVAAVGSS